ncbi:MAG: response regulator [Cyclobacteriaceae bacterium]
MTLKSKPYEEVQVLLVEDSPDDAELTMRSLSSLKLENEFVWVKDGVEAMDFLMGEGKYSSRNKSNKPKLILLDLKLPKLSGIEVLERIKNDEQLRTIPVVAITSSQEDSDLEACYDLGVNSFVTKPIDYKDFIEATQKVSLYWLLVNKTT